MSQVARGFVYFVFMFIAKALANDGGMIFKSFFIVYISFTKKIT